MSITVRPVTSDDRAAWFPLWQGYCDFYDTQLPAQVSANTFEEICKPGGAIKSFLALSADGLPVGMATYLFHQTTFSLGPRCYLEDLFTAESARSQGVGRALIEAVRDAAIAAGCDQLYWHTASDNEAGRRLYDKLAEANNLKYRMKLNR